MKDPEGTWRLVVFTKHNRHDDFLPVAEAAAAKTTKPRRGKARVRKARRAKARP
jgi:hypothetical protein